MNVSIKINERNQEVSNNLYCYLTERQGVRVKFGSLRENRIFWTENGSGFLKSLVGNRYPYTPPHPAISKLKQQLLFSF